MLQVIDEDREGSESGGESRTPAASLLAVAGGPRDHLTLQADDVSIAPILY